MVLHDDARRARPNATDGWRSFQWHGTGTRLFEAVATPTTEPKPSSAAYVLQKLIGFIFVCFRPILIAGDASPGPSAPFSMSGAFWQKGTVTHYST